MAFAPRALKLTISGSDIPGSSFGGRTEITGEPHSIKVTPDSVELTIDILLTAAPVGFATAAKALEAVLRNARNSQVKLTDNKSGLTLLDWIPGVDANATAQNVAGLASDFVVLSEARSRGSQLYRLSVTGRPPADTGSLAGRREFTYEVTMPATNRPELEVRGEYSANIAVNAPARYRAIVATRIASVIAELTAISSEFAGDWYLSKEVLGKVDDEALNTSFVRTYKYIIFNESVGVADDPDIGDSQLSIKRKKVKESDSKAGAGGGTGPDTLSPRAGKVTPVVHLTAIGSWSINRLGTGTVTGTEALEALWDGRLRKHVIAEMRLVVPNTKLVVDEEDLNVDPVENLIACTVTAQAVTDGAILSRKITVTDEIDFGRVEVPVWPSKDAIGAREPTPSYDFQGPKKITRTVETVSTYAADRTPNNFGALSRGRVLKPFAAGAKGVVPVRLSVRTTPVVEFTPDVGDKIDKTDITVTEVFRLKGAVPGAGGGGGTLPPSTATVGGG